MTHSSEHNVVVCGGGIVGLSTAIWLARANCKVALVDRNPIGDPHATSFGSAGVLAACSVSPVTAPGLILKGPKLLLDPNFPLFVRWSYLPRLTPWVIRYLSHANEKDTRRIAASLAPLISDTVGQHVALAGGTEAEQWIKHSDYGFAYPSRESYEDDAFTWALRRDAGFEPTCIEGQDVRDYEPALSDDFALLAIMKDHGYLCDPVSYLSALSIVAKSLGVTVQKAEVSDFEFTDGSISAVVTNEGILNCNAAVLATGAWSKHLALKLGLSVPPESERGYHIQFSGTNGGPRVPIMATTGKFVATPMDMGLRCAGVVEFGGLADGPSVAPLKLLKKKINGAFPALEVVEETTWLGHRPAPSDSLPVLGENRWVSCLRRIRSPSYRYDRRSKVRTYIGWNDHWAPRKHRRHAIQSRTV